MAAPEIYRSTDGSAPVLSGVAGSLVAVLDACLVNGYTGKTAAGWTKPYTATNAAVFRMGGGNQFYLDVNDSGASSGLTSASGREAAVRAYVAMSAVSTGTEPFPTTAQVAATDANWRKSATADATARGWLIVADDRSFILGVLDNDSASRYKLYTFGDIYSLKSGDAYRTAVTVRTSPGGTSTTGMLANALSSGSGGAIVGMYMPRIAAGTGASVQPAMTASGSTWETFPSFTNALDGNVYLSRLMLWDISSVVLRGWLRGLWEILTPVGISDGDTWPGTGELAGRSFMAVKNFVAADRGLAIETTAWPASS